MFNINKYNFDNDTQLQNFLNDKSNIFYSWIKNIEKKLDEFYDKVENKYWKNIYIYKPWWDLELNWNWEILVKSDWLQNRWALSWLDFFKNFFFYDTKKRFNITFINKDNIENIKNDWDWTLIIEWSYFLFNEDWSYNHKKEINKLLNEFWKNNSVFFLADLYYFLVWNEISWEWRSKEYLKNTLEFIKNNFEEVLVYLYWYEYWTLNGNIWIKNLVETLFSSESENLFEENIEKKKIISKYVDKIKFLPDAQNTLWNLKKFLDSVKKQWEENYLDNWFVKFNDKLPFIIYGSDEKDRINEIMKFFWNNYFTYYWKSNYIASKLWLEKFDTKIKLQDLYRELNNSMFTLLLQDRFQQSKKHFEIYRIFFNLQFNNIWFPVINNEWNKYDPYNLLVDEKFSIEKYNDIKELIDTIVYKKDGKNSVIKALYYDYYSSIIENIYKNFDKLFML